MFAVFELSSKLRREKCIVKLFRKFRLSLASTLMLFVLTAFGLLFEHLFPHVVVIELSGRLGNQLFQIAFSEYAKRFFPRRTKFFFLKNKYSNDTDYSNGFLAALPYIESIEEISSSHTEFHHIREERYSCKNLKIPPSSSKTILVIHGLFQCHVYAEAGRVRGRNFIKNSVDYKTALRRISYLKKEVGNVPLVAVHVRRGDYTKRFNKNLLEPVKLQYYKRGLNLMPKEAYYLIFTDDYHWCESNILHLFQRKNHTLIREERQVLTFVMMSLCDKFIIANSTFSWWAAFLAKAERKIVIAPRKWFGIRGKTSLKRYVPGWTKI